MQTTYVPVLLGGVFKLTNNQPPMVQFERLAGLIERVDLQNITVVVQDWGEPIGLINAVSMADRFSRLGHRAFSSEVENGSRQENASKNPEPRFDSIETKRQVQAFEAPQALV